VSSAARCSGVLAHHNVSYVLKDRSTDTVLFVVVFDLLPAEDGANEDHTDQEAGKVEGKSKENSTDPAVKVEHSSEGTTSAAGYVDEGVDWYFGPSIHGMISGFNIDRSPKGDYMTSPCEFERNSVPRWPCLQYLKFTQSWLDSESNTSLEAARAHLAALLIKEKGIK
jgi:hypothetical protein